jgi:hypothetical protein
MRNPSETPPSPTKRLFLKRFPVILLGTGVVTTVGGEISHEVKLEESGWFETDEAHWYPIYERHDQHEETLVPANIPPTLDVISMEGSYSNLSVGTGENNIQLISVYQLSTGDIINTTINGWDTIPKSHSKLVPDETQNYLSQHTISLAFGDIPYSDPKMFGYDNSTDITIYLRLALGALLTIIGNTQIVIGRNKTEISSRRSFLILSGIASILLGVTLAGPPLLKDQVHNQMMKVMHQNSAAERVYARLSTMITNATPEDLNGLFRELVQANKLMTLAKHLQSFDDSKKPRVGYSWHLGHRGIEDWLRLGQDITRACILAFPDDLLKQILKFNGDDPRALTSIRMFNIPKHPDYPVTDEIIEDTILTELLKQKQIVP